MDKPLKTFAVNYFRELVESESKNLKMGDTLTVGLVFYDKKGKPYKVVKDVVHRDDL